MTTDDFITKANLKHNNKYDYSNVNYVNAKTNIIISCTTHGVFSQRPSSHLSGYGCPKCSWNALSKANSKSVEWFTKKANLKHNNKYTYGNDFINVSSKVSITCDAHGKFEQRASAHLSGQGCPSCGIIAASSKLSSTTECFIQKASIVHNSVYTYDKTIYTKSRDKVTIICKIHGDFEQVANEHLKGHGCNDCARNSSLNHLFNKHKDTLTTFYVIKYKNLFKVGITLSNIRKRYSQEVNNVNDIEEVYTLVFNGYEQAYNYEQSVISSNKDKAYKGDSPFNNTGTSEVFTELPIYNLDRLKLLNSLL